MHLVLPRSFNDAQQIADKFKQGIPVILNLQSADAELSKRLIDFASGLTYALNGGMQRVADKVFLLTPRNVEVSAEQRARCSSAAASSTRRRTGAGRSRHGAKPDAAWAAATPSRRRRASWTSSSASTLLLIFAYILTSWIRLPYSLRTGPALPLRRLRARTCGSSAASCRRSGRSTSRRWSRSSALIVVDQIVVRLLERLH